MNHKIILCFFVFSIAGCLKNESKKNKIIKTIPHNFSMYKNSEMSILMRTMLNKNDELRNKIIKGDEIGSFNKNYLKIHSAKMTDISQKDKTFPIYAKHFETMQREIFLVDKKKRKNQFNTAINACISCHQNRCSGPIPRIKKLFIND